MPRYNSPLRYPGGKASLSRFFSAVLKSNGMRGGTYVEAYAGGAGAALELLMSEHVQQIVLNDADPCVFAFWDAVLNSKEELVELIRETPITIDEWRRQRDIYREESVHSRLEVAFATFYLNRCNRSGIIANGGPVGGLAQDGNWNLDARYNRDDLISRIARIYALRDRITVYNLDAIHFLKTVTHRGRELDNTLVYLDPPYYLKGRQLYLSYYRERDHRTLASYLTSRKSLHWILTYDAVPRIRHLYRDCHTIQFCLSYSARERRTGHELLIYRDDLIIPHRHLLAA
jgi:DNA adenine methylase